MDLSVIIVSYNAVDFLKLCLHSVFAASQSIQTEVFVVDNNSSDFSAKIVASDFPQCNLIANKNNPGFSVANNQAIKQAKGRYILILNPDTIVAEDTFLKLIAFMDSNKNIGSSGIKMIDGSGSFLPESKRGIPTPWTAFCKMSGLSAFFKRSKLFNEYHKGYIPQNQTHETEILAGAFMFIRKEALDKAGLFDESFFMYGEDIDLSYRIIQTGYLNYYFADSTIIHFKGESTNKDKVYRDRFYKAMIQFANKHFSRSYGIIFNILISVGIYFIKFLSSIKIHAKEVINIVNEQSFLVTTAPSSSNINLPFPNTPISPNNLDNHKNGTLIFNTQNLQFNQIIQIMNQYGARYKYRFLFDHHKIMIGSDKKFHKGQVQYL